MKENEAVVYLVTAFLAFAAFLFWAGQAHPQEIRPDLYTLQFKITLETGDVIGMSIPFESFNDCLTVASSVSGLGKMRPDYKVEIPSMCKEAWQ